MIPLRVLTRPDHLQTVFKDSDRHSKAANNNSGHLMSQLLGKCVGLISGDEWKTVWTSVEVPFLRKNATDYVPLVVRHIRKHFDELRTAQPESRLSQGLLDPAEDLKLLPFWVVGEVIYGELSEAQVAELRSLAPVREELFKHVIKGGVSRFAWARFLPTEANRLLTAFRQRWAAFNDGVYERAVAMGTNPPIVGMYELVRQGSMTREHLLHTLDESLYANLDVTTGGISWTIVFLAAYPEYQAKLRDELRDKYGGDAHRYALGSSSLLACCVAESARLKPLAAFSVPQSAPTERVVDGYVIPAGTDFIVDSIGLNVRHPFWGKDAERYRPERFLEKGALEMRYLYWRFGFGPRQCMGKYVADIIIRGLVIHLLENYDLALLGGEKQDQWGRNPEVWIDHPKMLIECVKKA